jgi:hypothetical protein
MNTDFKMPQLQLLLGAALLACASAASAQWMWVDAKGVKQVSDRAPPASIPAKNILKSPGAAVIPSAIPAVAGKAAGDAKPPASWTEREAAYRKEKAEKAKKDESLAADAAHQEKRQSICGAAAAARAQLDSGVRMRGPDKVWVGDEQRAEQSAAINNVLAECSK